MPDLGKSQTEQDALASHVARTGEPALTGIIVRLRPDGDTDGSILTIELTPADHGPQYTEWFVDGSCPFDINYPTTVPYDSGLASPLCAYGGGTLALQFRLSQADAEAASTRGLGWAIGPIWQSLPSQLVDLLWPCHNLLTTRDQVVVELDGTPGWIITCPYLGYLQAVMAAWTAILEERFDHRQFLETVVRWCNPADPLTGSTSRSATLAALPRSARRLRAAAKQLITQGGEADVLVR